MTVDPDAKTVRGILRKPSGARQAGVKLLAVAVERQQVQRQIPPSILRRFYKKKWEWWAACYGIRPEYRLGYYATTILVLFILLTVVIVKIVRQQDVPPTPGTPYPHPPEGDFPVTLLTDTSTVSPTHSPQPVVIRSLNDLDNLTNSTRSIIVIQLKIPSWKSISLTCPKLTKVTITSKISEHSLVQLLQTFAATLEELVLDVQDLCLGGRLNSKGVSALRPLSLPALQRLTFLKSNGCELVLWILRWDLPTCSTINFCSSYIDQVTFGAMVPNLTGLRSLELHDTRMCANCDVGSTGVVVASDKLQCSR